MDQWELQSRQRTQWYFSIECVVSIASRAEVHCKLTADFYLKPLYITLLKLSIRT